MKWDFKIRPNIKVYAVGRMSANVLTFVKNVTASSLVVNDALLLENRWIEECEHAKYFSVASYLCALYPKSFNVSISTVIRAFAVGRPVIVGDHGMIGRVVADNNAGLTCDTASHKELRATMEAAYDIYMRQPELYSSMSCAGADIAKLSELTSFKKLLAEWVRDC